MSNVIKGKKGFQKGMIPSVVFKKGYIPYNKGKKMDLSDEQRLKISNKSKETSKRLRPTRMSIEEKRRKAREYIARLKKEVFDVLGNKCFHCEFTDQRALQIDHINGGGVKELSRKNTSEKNYKGHYYNHVKKSVINNENKYQLLCANCNWIKRVVNGENLKKNYDFAAQELAGSQKLYKELGI